MRLRNKYVHKPSLDENLALFDPKNLNDDLALKVDWKPLERGGSTSNWRKLIKKNADILHFKVSASYYVFIAVLFFCLAGATGYLFFDMSSKGISPFKEFNFYVVLFFTMFSALLFFVMQPITFNKRVNLFWMGFKKPSNLQVKDKEVDACRLSEIHALQIIKEVCSYRSDSGTRYYNSYEINLVLKNLQRINVMDNADVIKIKTYAHEIANFLEVPVWDAS